MAFLTENEQKWSSIIKEELHVEDPRKLSWMSKMAQVHAVKEGLQNASLPVDGGIYATPLNVMGMGNPMAPQGVGFNGVDGTDHGAGIGNNGSDFHNPNYVKGSGDLPMSTLTMALEIAAVTIGLELVPVIPATGPWAWLSYMDFPYAGGKLGRINETALDGRGDGEANKPIYIKFAANLDADGIKALKALGIDESKITVKKGTLAAEGDVLFEGRYMGLSRIDGSVIVHVLSAKKYDKETSAAVNASIVEIFNTKGITFTCEDAKIDTVQKVKDVAVTSRAELVTGAADHIQGFANFAKDGAAGLDPMTRAENETGVGNMIGARMFTKMVQMGAYEVTGAVTRQQLQDMPLYGVDVIGKILEQMQNQISQEINNRILDRVFKLGVTNAVNQYKYQGVNLNLYLAGATDPDTLPVAQFDSHAKYMGIDNLNHAAEMGSVANATKNTSAENVTTHQRRIMSRLLASANLIAQVSRRGRGQWAVMNTKLLTAVQDSANFVIAPMTNTLTQDGSNSLYFAGSIAGMNIYVDPYMAWDDTRVCVGRKSNGNEPGVIFMPYILADTVQTVVEGTMAPKLLCNSRFAIVDAGFYPEQSYYTFMVQCANDMII